MPLVSLKRTPAEKAARSNEFESIDIMPDYPYGLELRLGEEEIKKLGITTLPTVGEDMEISATVSVNAVRQEDRGDGLDRSIELQVTALDLRPTKEKSDVLYSGEDS